MITLHALEPVEYEDMVSPDLMTTGSNYQSAGSNLCDDELRLPWKGILYLACGRCPLTSVSVSAHEQR